ncbi:Lrp/AsnC family transcriptional regulator [Rugosimonospora acidiphila]|uniref:Lrp/AsnC family transcriptional regulator n=1 Tax=Rugosimonospora acidiphila TaxID=556531 RepID=UPI0031F04FF9
MTSPESGRLAVRLDDVDRAIIGELVRDGRMSIRALADKVHISRANAYSRVGRLVEEGAITGFTAVLDPSRVGLSTAAFINLTIDQSAWRSVAEKLREVPYVDHIALVGGDYDVLVSVQAPDNVALRSVVLERLNSIPGVRSTRTWLVFEESKGVGVNWQA